MATTKQLSPEKKRQLLLAISEMKARGIPLPEEATSIFRKKEHIFPKDPKGYFVRRDGGLYRATDAQASFIANNSRYSMFVGGRGSGKALSIHTPILTDSGWKDMLDVSIADRVFGSDGKLHDVIGTSDVMYNHDCYEVWFDDNTFIVADAEHLWETETKNYRKALFRRKYKHHKEHKDFQRVFTTDEIRDSLMYGKERNHSIPIVDKLSPELVDYKKLPSLSIDPYVLGYWLGDGTSSAASITVGDEDEAFVFSEFSKRGYFRTGAKSGLTYGIQYENNPAVFRDKKSGRFVSNEKSFYSQLSSIGVVGNKHVPVSVLLARYGYRIEVFRGLMDSDGTISDEGKAEFTTTSLPLAKGFLSLAYSLGIKVAFREGRVKFDGRYFTRYRFTFVPKEQIFRIPRKAARVDFSQRTQDSRRRRRFITKVVRTKSVPVKCISVDSEDHLYLAGESLIPTHNSAAGSQKALKKIEQGMSGAVINPLFSDFRDSTWQEFKQWIPWDMVVPSQRHRVNDEWQPSQPFTMVFENGASVVCKGLKNEGAGRGGNWNWLWYDESRNDITGNAWRVATAAVRVGKDPQAWTTTTPMGTSHWLYEFFVEKNLPQDVLAQLEEDGQTLDEFIQWFQGSIRDNKANLDPGFYTSILTSYPSGWLRDREVDGLFSEEGGKIGDSRWITANEDGESKVIDYILPDQMKILRYWDLAATEKKQAKDDPDEMVGALISKHKGEKENLYQIQDMIGGYWGDEKAIEVIANVARHDGAGIPVWVEQEPGASGKITVAAVKEYFKRFPELQSHTVMGFDTKKVGDRVLGANLHWFGVAQEGRMYIKKASWNKKFLKQLDGFTQIVHDDRVTVVTNSMYILNPFKIWKRTSFYTV